MTVGASVLPQPVGADKRRAWLQAVVSHFGVPGDPASNREVLKVAEAVARVAGHDGISRASRRVLMASAELDQAYVYQRAIADLMEAGFLHRVNPGAPPRHAAEHALVLAGTFIRGGDPGDAPRLVGGARYKVVRSNRSREAKRATWTTLTPEDDLWDEPRPHCEHTLRTCSPDCPEWGGR